MTVVLSQNDRRTKLGVLLMDVLHSEKIDFNSEVTLYPVEDGTTISDHITEGPERLSISGVIATADVSDGSTVSAAFGYALDNSAKLIDVIEALRAMHKNREMITVSTGQLLHENMGFASLSAERTSDGGGGNWLSIRAELIKIRKVKLRSVDVPAPETTAAPASGRAGETNKPAGASKPGTGANAEPNRPPRSALLQSRNALRDDPQALQRNLGAITGWGPAR